MLRSLLNLLCKLYAFSVGGKSNKNSNGSAIDLLEELSGMSEASCLFLNRSLQAVGATLETKSNDTLVHDQIRKEKNGE